MSNYVNQNFKSKLIFPILHSMFTTHSSLLSWKPTHFPSIYKICYIYIQIAVKSSQTDSLIEMLAKVCQLLREGEEHIYVENGTKIDLK